MAWVATHRLKVALLVGALAVSVGGVVVLWLTLASQGGRKSPGATLEQALAMLDRGAYVEASSVAKALRRQEDFPPSELGGPAFVLGAAAAYEARKMGPKEGSRHYLLAAGYLEEGRDRGFPPGRKAEGLLLLGESLYHSGQTAASRPVLGEALEVNRSRKSEIYDLLASAYLEDASPNLPRALEYNTRYLSDRLLSRAQRERGLLRQAQIFLRMGKLAECRETLKQIPPDAQDNAAAVIVRGQLLMREAQKLSHGRDATAADKLKAHQTYEQAVKELRKAEGHDTLSAQATRKAQYLIGLCFVETGESAAAAAQFERTRATYPGTPEAMAASFQDAELARQLGRDSDALSGYRHVLKALTDREDLVNPWLPREELQAKLLKAYQHYMESGKFGVALQLAQQLHPLFPRAKKTQWVAETLQKWGEALLAEADRHASDEAEQMRRQGRTQLRRAGRAYRELAGLETVTRQYTDHLWSSAENYLAGHDYTDAEQVLREYLKNETRRRHSPALANLGEALLAMDRVDDALVALRDCVDFHPRDAAAFRARLLASGAYLERGETAKAEELLEDNLSGILSPSSKEWRQSLFALGHVLLIDGQYEKAIARLDEAVRRYPEATETLDARYLIGQCYRRSAEAMQKRLSASEVAYVRQARAEEVRVLREKALKQFQGVRETLDQRQQSVTLAAQERAILRNTYFAIGDVQFDLGLYADAVQTYVAAAYRYQDDPVALLAYLQIASAYERMGKPGDARNTLEQGKVVLGRIKPDAPFERITPYERTEWEELFEMRLSGL